MDEDELLDDEDEEDELDGFQTDDIELKDLPLSAVLEEDEEEDDEMTPALDIDGNPILDDEGNPLTAEELEEEEDEGF